MKWPEGWKYEREYDRWINSASDMVLYVRRSPYTHRTIYGYILKYKSSGASIGSNLKLKSLVVDLVTKRLEGKR